MTTLIRPGQRIISPPGIRVISGTQAARGAGVDYIAKVLTYSPIAYWPLNETSGATADNAEGTAAMDGTYTGVTLNNATGPDGSNGAPLWNGADYLNIYSTDLRDAFSGATGTVMIWLKVSGAGVWTDGNYHLGMRLFSDGSNLIDIRIKNSSSHLEYIYAAAGTIETVTFAASSTAWFHTAITWTKPGEEMKAFFNGSQAGSTQGTLGGFAGVLAAANTVIGAASTAAVLPWDGWIAHAAIWDSVKTPAEILDLATV